MIEALALLLQDIVVKGVVAGHGHQGAKTNANGVKDLSCCIHPHLQNKGMSKINIEWQHQSSILIHTNVNTK